MNAKEEGNSFASCVETVNLRMMSDNSTRTELDSKRMLNNCLEAPALPNAERSAQNPIDALSSHICILDETGTILTVNLAWRNFAAANQGLSDKTAEGVNYLSICDAVTGVDAEIAVVFGNGIRDVMSGKCEEFFLEYPCHSPTSKHWFSGRVSRFLSNGAIRIVVTHENITQRKQAEKNWWESHQLNLQVLRHAHDGIIVQDRQLRYLIWNPFMEKLTGLASEKVIGRYPLEVFPFLREIGVLERLERILREETSDSCEFQYDFPVSKRSGWLSDTIAPLRDGRGEIIGVIGIVREITERKRAEEAIMHLNEDLEHRVLERTAQLAGAIQDLRKEIASHKQTEEKINNILASISEAFFSMDNQLVMNYFNDAAEELMGRRREDILGRNLFDAFPELKGSIFEINFRKAMAEKKALSFETYFDRKPYCNWYDVQVYPQSGGLSVYFQVITQRKQAETSLRQLFQAVEQSPIIVVITDRQGFIEYVNPRFCQVTGYVPEEVIGKNPRLLKSGQTTAIEYKRLWETICAGKEWRGEFLNRKKNGDDFWEWAIISPVKNESGQITHFLASKEDITERKRRQAELLKAQEIVQEQAALLEIARDAIAVFDLEGRVRFWNPGCERLLGWKAEEILGLPLNPETFVECKEKLIQAQKQVMETGDWSGELILHDKNRKRIIVQSSRSLVRDKTGQPKAILVVKTDITEQKLLESRLLRMQREESVGRLANGVAHDLNNVMTPIIMAAELLQQESNNSETNEYLEMILSSAVRGADMVRQLLLYSRGVDTKHVELDLCKVIKETARMIQKTFPKMIQLRLNLPETVWPVDGDITQLHQVLLNLCVNARDAMPDGGVLSIGVEHAELDGIACQLIPGAKAGPYVVMKIRDTGTGISPDILENIFDPFFTTKDLGQGTGLGLSTVQGIVKNHNGFVEVSSHLDQGSQFTVYLPAKKSASKTETDSSAQIISRGAGELILVVDDEEIICRSIKCALESHGYQVILARHGLEALSLYQKNKLKIQAVILDMWLPHMDGLTTIHQLEQMDPSVCVIAVSGLPDYEKKAQEISPVVKAFLLKPLKTNQILLALQKVLKSVPSP